MNQQPGPNDEMRPIDPLITGSGKYLWEVVRPWGELPEGIAFGIVSSVAVDAADRVYVYQRSTPPLLVFDADGTFIRAWGWDRTMDAHGIAVDPSGRVYLIDRDAHEILVLSPSGDVEMTIGRRGRPSLGAPFNHPADICVAPDGELYVADGYGNFRVHRFAADGRHIDSWGRPGRGTGEFRVPHGIWIHGDKMYVADRENGRVQIFSRDGEFLTEWDHFFRPTDVFVDPDGTTYVTDLVPSLSVLDADGTLVARGRPTQNIAHSVWADSTGSLYVAEGSYSRVTKLVRQPASV